MVNGQVTVVYFLFPGVLHNFTRESIFSWSKLETIKFPFSGMDIQFDQTCWATGKSTTSSDQVYTE